MKGRSVYDAYEEAMAILDARRAKVAAMLAVLPRGKDVEEVLQIADLLERMPSPDRKWVAERAGCRVPSDETWGELVKAARARLPASVSERKV